MGVLRVTCVQQCSLCIMHVSLPESAQLMAPVAGYKPRSLVVKLDCVIIRLYH